MQAKSTKGIFEIIERLPSSRYGNPRWLVMVGDVVLYTQPDSCLSYEVPNLQGQHVTATYNRRYGRLSLLSLDAV